MTTKTSPLSLDDLEFFKINGYLILPNAICTSELERMLRLAKSSLENRIEPFELEAQLGYPGAPNTIHDEGGGTIRRLLNAYDRDIIWQNWAQRKENTQRIKQLFDNKSIAISRAHHNCIMTKSPQYSSDTGWHQDIRYWNFESDNLINFWLALGKENRERGGLRLIPGSHRKIFSAQQFDESVFFKTNDSVNQEILRSEVIVELNPGDAILFHAKLLHAASRNTTQEIKYSLVFTYKDAENRPIAMSRSSSLEDVVLN